jgi:predicted ATP-grasp superfamily ATP-dependent carboligase
MTRILDIYTEMAELRVELSHCILTRKERRESLRRLEELLAEAERRRHEEEGV